MIQVVWQLTKMKCLVAVLFSIISFAYAAPDLLGTKECTYGPSYWCSHISKAQKCGAVQHCIDTVWKTQVIKTKNTEACTLCKIGMDEVKQMLSKNGTEEKIKQYMSELCDKLTEPTLKTECDAVVTTYLPVILNMIKSSMTSEQICAAIKMCTGFEDTVQHKTQVVSSGDVCTDCTNFFTDIQNMILSNETEAQIEDQLKQLICAQLGPVQDVCNFVVEEYVPQLLQTMGQLVDPPTTCRVIGFCNNKGDIASALKLRMKLIKVFKKLEKKPVAGAAECAACKDFITDLRSLDQDATMQAKVKDFIKTEVCALLGGVQQECDDLVDQYASVLFDLLANELDPDAVCSFVGLCTASKKQTSFEALDLVPATPIQPLKTSGEFCDVCKLAMDYLDSELAKNSTKDAIKAALDELCSKLPGAFTAECNAFIGQYEPAILALLEQELNPTIICDKLGFCTPLKTTKKVQTPKSSANSIQCVICEYVMSTLERELQQNFSRAAVESALDRICSLMPSTISQECTDFVKAYAPVIINLLIQDVKPKEVCTAIKLCTAAVKVLPKPVIAGILLRGEPIATQVQPLKNTETCLVCETVLNYVAEALKENKTEAAILSLLQEACTVLPKSMADECQGLVIAFGGEIVKMLQQELDPKQVCTELGICTSNKMKTAVKDELKNVLLDLGKMKKTDNKLYFKPTVKKLGQRKCSYGPAYWCDSLDNAKECGMVEHCKTHGWKNKA